jgi:hypothetical protein
VSQTRKDAWDGICKWYGTKKSQKRNPSTVSLFPVDSIAGTASFILGDVSVSQSSEARLTNRAYEGPPEDLSDTLVA